MQTSKASDVTLADLVEQFELTQTFDPQFFKEWQAASAEVAIADIQRLDQVKSNFAYLLQRPPFSEEAVNVLLEETFRSCVDFVKMVVLSFTGACWFLSTDILDQI